MKWKLNLLLVLIIGALAGSWIKNMPGFVIIAYQKTTYEMRLWIAISLILLIFSLIFFLFSTLRFFMTSKGKFKNWRGSLGWKRSRKKTIEGMLAFSEGRWKKAEEAMSHAAQNSDTQLINYLLAAESAQHQNSATRRDSYLRLAYKVEPDAKIAIGLTQARLQLQHGQYEQALASLNELKLQNASHPYVLKLLCRLFETLQDWKQLLELIPSLKKQKVFNENDLLRIETDCVSGLLNRQVALSNLKGLQQCWLDLPAALRKSKSNILLYARLLLSFKQMDEADAMLKPLIKKHADAKAITLYGNAITSNPTKQLNFLENWYHANQDAPREIFLSLGKLAYFAKLWGKANDFLTTSLQHEPSAETFLMMAKTQIQLGDKTSATDYYQKGLEFTCGEE